MVKSFEKLAMSLFVCLCAMFKLRQKELGNRVLVNSLPGPMISAMSLVYAYSTLLSCYKSWKQNIVQ
jgi:hypothetical protein